MGRGKGGCVGKLHQKREHQPETTTAVAACQLSNICHQQGGVWQGCRANFSLNTSRAKSLQAVTKSIACSVRTALFLSIKTR